MGLYKLPSDTIPIILPVSIKPGEGLTLFLKTAIAIGSFYSIQDEIEEVIQKPGSTLIDLIITSTINWRINKSEELIGESYDFFGNKTEYGIGVRGIMDIMHINPDSIHQPVYLITFYSSKSKMYNSLISPYSTESTNPFEICKEICPFDRKTEIYQVEVE